MFEVDLVPKCEDHLCIVDWKCAASDDENSGIMFRYVRYAQLNRNITIRSRGSMERLPALATAQSVTLPGQSSPVHHLIVRG